MNNRYEVLYYQTGIKDDIEDFIFSNEQIQEKINECLDKIGSEMYNLLTHECDMLTHGCDALYKCSGLMIENPNSESPLKCICIDNGYVSMQYNDTMHNDLSLCFIGIMQNAYIRNATRGSSDTIYNYPKAAYELIRNWHDIKDAIIDIVYAKNKMYNQINSFLEDFIKD